MENKHLWLWAIILFVGVMIISETVDGAITIVRPANYTWTANAAASQKFAFSFDNATGIDANCTFYMSQTGGIVNQYGVVNQTSNDPVLGKVSYSNMTAINLTVNNANASAGYASGLYYWNITCINNSDVGAGVVTTTSLTNWFLYDAEAPTGNISSPANNSFSNAALIHLNGTANDSFSGTDFAVTFFQFSNSTGACWQWANRSWGSCDETPLAGQATGDLALLNKTLRVNNSNSNQSHAFGKNVSDIILSDDKYNYVVYLQDSPALGSGVPNNKVINISFVYDTTPPSAAIHSINLVSNYSWTTSRIIKTNLTVTDRATGHFNLSLYTTVIQNSTNITTGNATAILFNITATIDDTYTLNLTAVDNATNKNSTVPLFYIRVDATIPNSTIFSVNSLTNNSWFNTRALRINLTAADVNINHFNVTINATNSSNISTGGVYDTLYNLSVGSDATYLVNLATVDNATNSNSTAFYIRVDATIPNSTIFSVNSLANNSWFNTRVFNINLTAADVNINHFNVTINATNSSNISTGGVYDTLYNLSVGSDATYIANLATVDNATNANSTAFYIRVDATIPTSAINNISKKVNNSWINNRMLSINFTASDTNIKNWSLYVYNTTDIFNNSPSGWNYTYYESNTSAEVNFSAPRDGTYFFNLTTNDNASNANTTAKLFYIRVDATNPSIGTPSFSGVSSTGATISVEMGETNLDACTYSGGSSGTLSCSGSTCTASLSGLSASIIYSYSVSCTDLAGNSATGASNSFLTSSASSGSGSGGSGGGSGSSVAGQFSKKVWSSLLAGETATVKSAEGDGLGVTEVSFKVDKIAYGVIADIKKVEKTEVPAEIGGKKVHNYLKFTVTGAIKEENTNSRTMLFKVAKKWLADNALDKEKIALYRYADNKWNTLPTKIVQEDDTTVYYNAGTPGFSYFAIAESEEAAEVVAPPQVEEVPSAEVTEPIVEAPAEEAPEEASAPVEEAKNNTWLWVVLVVVIAAIIAGIYFWPKKKGKGV